ncbi:MAG: AmmeMemoRadiSam system protein B [Clostridia bacterium]|jgi:AmmeMemoRadiSam system protein B|nr:AmmeMemoRadiSam system protein B [Clostridiales bacterium]
MKKPSTRPVNVLVFFLLILYTFTGCAGWAENAEGQAAKSYAHPCSFYNERDFFESLSRAGAKPSQMLIRGGVIPHHLVAGYMIADFFSMLSGQEVDRVILIGPNHHLKGPRVISSRHGWRTAFGILETETELVERLAGSGIAGFDEEAIAGEHSIAAIVPYIKYYLPDSAIVPLILHPDLTGGETENLADLLLQHTGDRDVFVASVDFSHYLKGRDAAKRDEVTLDAIKGKDYSRLLMMGDEYLDSPSSIVTLLKVMEKSGSGSMEVIHNSNSALLLGRDIEETTSYFTLIYYQNCRGGLS